MKTDLATILESHNLKDSTMNTGSVSSQHAPGPWELSGKTISHLWKTRRYAVATVNSKLFTRECTAANARILTAAPDLLSALEEALRVLVTAGGFPDKGKGRTDEQQAAYDAARKAIRKATQ